MREKIALFSSPLSSLSRFSEVSVAFAKPVSVYNSAFLLEKSCFLVIHIEIDSEKPLIYIVFMEKTKLHQIETALVDRNLRKSKISTEIQKFWKLSLFARQRQQGSAHMIQGRASA